MVRRIRVKRRGYRRADGTRVQATTYMTPDLGKPGNTPKSKRFYKHGTHTGWEHTMPAAKRRTILIRKYKSPLKAARAKQELANITKRSNPSVNRAAQADANYFFRLARSKKK